MKYTNQHKIPLPLAVFLATEHYDYVPNTISVTGLLKPIRQTILANRLESTTVDLSDMVSSRMGTAIHDAIERAWANPEKALKALGYSDDVIKRIKVNPDVVKPDDIPVYMEKRTTKHIDGFNITGKFDFVADGKVQDFKSTSTFSYTNQTKANDYIMQGSIYRWLNQDIITKDDMTIHYIFTDWSKAKALADSSYPQARVLSQSYPLLPLYDTELFIKERLNQYVRYRDSHEREIPLCTDKDLWRKPTVYKYYKNSTAKRATKVYDNAMEAYARKETDGGHVLEVKGKVSACNYCPARAICSQYEQLVLLGDIA